MAAPATLDPSQLLAVFNGSQITGYFTGSQVKVVRNEDAMTLVVGADGEAARIRNRNRSGTIEFTLHQASASNDILSGMANLDEAGLPGGSGALLIKDLTGRALYSAESAWVKKQAEGEHGKEIGGRTWVLETNNLAVFVGGNN